MNNDIENKIKDLESQVEQSNNLVDKFKNLLDVIPDPIFMKDENLNWLYANNSTLKLYKLNKQTYIGKSDTELLSAEYAKECVASDKKTIKSNNPSYTQEVIETSDTKMHYYDVVKVPCYDEKESFRGLIGVGRDISEQKEAQDELAKLALTDILTSLDNRLKLTNDLKIAKKPSMAIFDIDGFANINDFYGHDMGDFILKELAKNIFFLVKNKASIYRYTSDKFALLVDDMDKEQFLSLVKYVLEQADALEYSFNEITISIKLSVAISFESKKNIIQTVDMILSELKKRKVNFLVYNKSLGLEGDIKNNIEWNKKLRDALREDRIISYYQPIMNNSNGKIEKYESLVRLKNLNETIEPPSKFLDVSKKSKQYIALTKKVIENTFEKFKDLDVEFSINLTMEDILSDEINILLDSKLNDKRYNSRVVLEIVESEGMEKAQTVYRFIERMHKYACKIAIDDFGTGYSNFEYLIKLTPEYIKIDGSMIKDITTNTDNEEVVKIIIDFAKKRKLKTIAEYVSSKEIFNKVIELGIDYSQGYYIGEPKEELLKHNV